MAKERNYNPVQAQRKADKAREVKKGVCDIHGTTSFRCVLQEANFDA